LSPRSEDRVGKHDDEPEHGQENDSDMLNSEMLKRIEHGHGFIAALDQSGGSTPKALKGYGIDAD
jgi:hypothetical protein